MLFKKSDKITGSYDVIIVGSGWAGLTAANKLARNGRKVLLLEAHNKLGGLATWFRRNNGEYIFDISLHGFPGGMKKTCRKYWSKEIADSIVPLEQVRFANPQFEISTDFTKQDYARILEVEFKIEKAKVDAFFEELDQMNFYDAPKMTNGELFNKYFPDRNDVVRFLLEPITYANGSTLEDEAITYGIVFSNFMSKGVYTFCGGTDVLIDKLQQELIENGVDIKRHSLVDEIIVKDNQVQGVKIQNQEVFSKAVLSNANLLSTINHLVGKDNFSKTYLEKAQKVRLNTSSCQVYIGIKAGETIPNLGDLLFYSESEQFSTEQLLSKEVSSQTFSFYYPKMRPDRDNYYAIVSSSNARYEDWVGLSEDEYKKRKDHLISKALTVLEKYIPNIRDKVGMIEAATPLTVERYTHHLKGSSFGTKFEGLDVSINMNKEIQGLFHSGSVGIIMSGWLGAANYGVIKSHEVESYLVKELSTD
ncbi:MAG: NAD(P)/FAD-dependent oxidoreductase [Bacteriovoracaceae bacterium]|nr:NAD(P)/FAD-dependent oxidoreductase [Bacteriovoracaceae bacterium]